MRNYLSLNSFVTLLFGVVTCTTSAFGQNRKIPNAGGEYRSADVNGVNVKGAAAAAVKAKAAELKQKLVLKSIAKAETQAVAGYNYRMCIEVYAPPAQPGEDGVTAWVKVTYYSAIAGTSRIISWEDVDSCE